jgi:hypothetical protein
VNEGNICVLGEATNETSTQTATQLSSMQDQVESDGNLTILSDADSELPTENATLGSITFNETSTPSTLPQTIASLSSEPDLPYACYSNTFTCFCDGTEDCNRLTSSGECKAEVRSVEGKPGLGECDWNAKS